MLKSNDNIDKFRGEWVNKEINDKASVNFWNMFAETQKRFNVPNFENNAFLKLLKDKKMLNPEGKALDVGCGTGKYSFTLSDSFKELVGIDFSADMLNIAKDKASELNTRNINFICSKWQDFDIEKAGFANNFDLVFAHMTPAVSDANSFEKMIESCKGFCVMSKPTSRVDLVADKIMEYAGIKDNNNISDVQFSNALTLLEGLGYEPKVEYEKEVWESKKETDFATKMYINRIKQIVNISDEYEMELKNYIKTFEEDGYIYEKTDTLISTVYWEI